MAGSFTLFVLFLFRRGACGGNPTSLERDRMTKIQFYLNPRQEKEETRAFYRTLGLHASIRRKYLKLKSSKQTKIVSVTPSRICLRAQNHKEIMHMANAVNTDTAHLAADVETEHVPRSHHIPFQITITDPLGNTVIVSPSLEPKTIAILTSGGDAPGMNSAIWAITKTAIKHRSRVLGVMNGFEGLINGYIRDLTEEECTAYIIKGGTFLKSARSSEFRTKEGRAKAIENLRGRKVDVLVVIGGDGSMRGALQISQEFPGLNVVFVAASIDHDIPGTESIGAATALHRIIESVDCIESTMNSHHRAFVVEVMGRRCGWLALMSAFASNASYVLLPEDPKPREQWEEELVEAIKKKRETGKGCSYIILSEGAVSYDGTRITPEDVCKVLHEKLGLESRATVLGHTQRGGFPCAYDRVLAPMVGVMAAEVALSKPGAYGIYMEFNEGKIMDLETCVGMCDKIDGLITSKDTAGLQRARGKDFMEMYEIVKKRARVPKKEIGGNIAVAHVGSGSAGADEILLTIAEYGRLEGKRVYAVDGGLVGLIDGKVRCVTENCLQSSEKKRIFVSPKQLKGIQGEKWAKMEKRWDEKVRFKETDIVDCPPHKVLSSDGVEGRGMEANRTFKVSPELIKKALENLNCDVLVLIGGFDALIGAKKLMNIGVKVLVTPCTVSNNLPGTDESIGSDTALDTITSLCDNLKTGNQGKMAFVVEVHGGECGYLTVASGLAIGAIDCYFPEETGIIKRIRRTAKNLTRTFKKQKSCQLVIRGDGAMKGVCNETLAKILETDGGTRYNVRHCTLGYIQKGNVATAIDRVKAARIGAACVQFDKTGSWVLGNKGWGVQATTVEDAIKDVNEEKRRVKKATWLEMARTYRVLG